jgi:hypothetical protein
MSLGHVYLLNIVHHEEVKNVQRGFLNFSILQIWKHYLSEHSNTNAKLSNTELSLELSITYLVHI